MTTYNDKTEDNLSRQIRPMLTNTQADGSGTFVFPVSDASGHTILAAGTNLIGKVGIDQTTPGTTNGVRVTFGGAVYRNSDVAAADTARRFETTAKKLRNVTILVSGKSQLFGDDTAQDYPVNPGDTLSYDYIDISTLYFKNAAAGENGTVYILGVEE